MSDQIREQVSALLDGELPGAETELLLKRLARDAELRESFGRYALIGESLRGGARSSVTRGFAARVSRAIDGEPESAAAARLRVPSPGWWRPFAGAAVAAGVAAVAVVALQQRAVAPGPSGAALTAQNAAVSHVSVTSAAGAPGGAPAAGGAALGARNAAVRPGASGAAPREALAYTVPAVTGAVPAAMPSARLTNYLFAHSKYSSVLGQSNMLSGLLAGDDEPASGPAAEDSAEPRPPAQGDQTAP